MNPHQVTKQATHMKPLDLTTLAKQVIERNKCNLHGNSTATYGKSSLLKTPAITPQTSSCQVSPYKERNHATKEVIALVTKISLHYGGGDDEKFLTEYVDEILKHNDINKTLACLHDLARQILPVNNSKIQETKGI